MTFPASGYLSNAARTEGEMKTALEDFLAATKLIRPQIFTASGSVVVPAGVTSITRVTCISGGGGGGGGSDGSSAGGNGGAGGASIILRDATTIVHSGVGGGGAGATTAGRGGAGGLGGSTSIAADVVSGVHGINGHDALAGELSLGGYGARCFSVSGYLAGARGGQGGGGTSGNAAGGGGGVAVAQKTEFAVTPGETLTITVGVGGAGGAGGGTANDGDAGTDGALIIEW